jgi:hypothetical protein
MPCRGEDSFASTVVVNFTIGKGKNKLNSNADGFGQQNLDHVALCRKFGSSGCPRDRDGRRELGIVDMDSRCLPRLLSCSLSHVLYISLHS